MKKKNYIYIHTCTRVYIYTRSIYFMYVYVRTYTSKHMHIHTLVSFCKWYVGDLLDEVRVLCFSGVLILLWGEHLQHFGAEKWEQCRFLLNVSSGERRQKVSPCSTGLRCFDPPLPPHCWQWLTAQLKLDKTLLRWHNHLSNSGAWNGKDPVFLFWQYLGILVIYL